MVKMDRNVPIEMNNVQEQLEEETLKEIEDINTIAEIDLANIHESREQTIQGSIAGGAVIGAGGFITLLAAAGETAVADLILGSAFGGPAGAAMGFAFGGVVAIHKYARRKKRIEKFKQKQIEHAKNNTKRKQVKLQELQIKKTKQDIILVNKKIEESNRKIILGEKQIDKIDQDFIQGQKNIEKINKDLVQGDINIEKANQETIQIKEKTENIKEDRKQGIIQSKKEIEEIEKRILAIDKKTDYQDLRASKYEAKIAAKSYSESVSQSMQSKISKRSEASQRIRRTDPSYADNNNG